MDDVKTLVLKAIHKEIEKLPRSCRQVFKMAYLEGLSNSQIAETLSINNQSVRNHKLRAIKILRMALLRLPPLAYIIFSTLLANFPLFHRSYFAVCQPLC